MSAREYLSCDAAAPLADRGLAPTHTRRSCESGLLELRCAAQTRCSVAEARLGRLAIDGVDGRSGPSDPRDLFERTR